MKPVNPSCLRNQHPIFSALQPYLSKPGDLLEIGSGTGQHAVFMGEQLPHINWQASDIKSQLSLCNEWVNDSEKLNPAIELDVSVTHWHTGVLNTFQYVYASNVIHYVSNRTVKNLFKGAKHIVKPEGLFIVYGPFHLGDKTSIGNLKLDQWLKSEVHPQAGIKQMQDILKIANHNGFLLHNNIPMPANNHLIIFIKESCC